MKITTQSLLFLLALAGSAILANAQSSYKCPEDKGKTITRGNKKYELHCAEGVRGLAFDTVPGADAVKCAEICAAKPECKHVTHNGNTNMCELKKDGELFRYTKYPYMTWYFIEEVTTAPVTGGTGDNAQKPVTEGDTGKPDTGKPDTGKPDTGKPDTGGGSSGPSDGDGNKASYSCPEDNLRTYTTGDVTYELRCGHGHSKGHWRPEPASTLKDCADRCAAIPDCNSCDFQRYTRECFLMKAPSESTPWPGNLGDAWYPVDDKCPKIRATKADEKPKVTSDLSCPENDGKIFEGSDGTWFYLQCCTDTDAAAVLDLVPASSHKDCLEKCVVSKKCKSFTYPAPKGSNLNCKLYGHGKFSQSAQPGAHYAFVTDPPTEEPKMSNAKLCSTECPEAHGQLFVSSTGENFQMTCDKRHGTTYLNIDRRPSFEACMSACAAMPACHSAEYEPRTQKCYYGNNHNQPGIDAKAFVSAHSLGCAGACSSCKKGCDSLNSKPLPADAAGCDADDGSIITSGGENFNLKCRHCYRMDGGFKATGAENMGDCAKACADNFSCHGANWMGPVWGCWMFPTADTEGKPVEFYRDARCDALMPQHRGLANFDDVKVDNPPFTTRDW